MSESISNYDLTDDDFAYRVAGRIAQDAKWRLNVNQRSWEEHYQDVVQEVLIKLYECEALEKPLVYAEIAGRNAATAYIIRHIYKQTVSSAYKRDDPAEAKHRYEHYSLRFGQISQSKKAKYHVTRPVELIIIARQTSNQKFWEEVQRTFIEILAGMRKTIRYKGLARMAHMLTLHCQGYRVSAIAVELGLAEVQVWKTLIKARKSIKKFLEMPDLLKGITQASGYYKTLRSKDLTAEIINGHSNYQVIMPCGHFTVRVESNRSPRMIKRVNQDGRSKLFQYTLRRCEGGIRLEQVYQAAYYLHDKMQDFIEFSKN